MQHSSLLRALSGFGLRLESGGLLLLGSVGLLGATSLLSHPATYDGAARRAAWAVTTEAGLTGFNLNRSSTPRALLVPVSNSVLSAQRLYLFTDTAVYRAPASGQFSYLPTGRGATANEARGAVQRSWATIKLLFR